MAQYDKLIDIDRLEYFYDSLKETIPDKTEVDEMSDLVDQLCSDVQDVGNRVTTLEGKSKVNGYVDIYTSTTLTYTLTNYRNYLLTAMQYTGNLGIVAATAISWLVTAAGGNVAAMQISKDPTNTYCQDRISITSNGLALMLVRGSGDFHGIISLTQL